MASHLPTYCTKKIADPFFISSLDHILHTLLGINKAHLYKVENSPGSSFCSAAAHSTIFHTTGAHCCPVSISQLFPLLPFVVSPSSVIKSLNHSLYMLIPNYLKGLKKKKKPVARGLSFEPLLVMGENKPHPSLTFVLLKTIPVFPEPPTPPPHHHPPPAVLRGAVSVLIHGGAQLIGTIHLLQGDSVSPRCDACRDVILACCHDLVLLDVLIEAEMDISCNYSFRKIL